MSRLHMKGYVLHLLAERGALWDHQIFDAVHAEYGLSGGYWLGTVRLTLTDLYSGGLLDEIETTVDPQLSGGEERVLFKFQLNDFGRERMRQSGLLGVNT
ncbi:hypothetical protein [Pseudonocardia spinosispora]|uniref:hypothetical protein n=1 Tax=Pseudonocardia spinosispora TaxID=103441 RepID=UPI000413E806|nr:hypothetical protein [Pseudonocardia spinosispora]